MGYCFVANWIQYLRTRNHHYSTGGVFYRSTVPENSGRIGGQHKLHRR